MEPKEQEQEAIATVILIFAIVIILCIFGVTYINTKSEEEKSKKETAERERVEQLIDQGDYETIMFEFYHKDRDELKSSATKIAIDVIWSLDTLIARQASEAWHQARYLLGLSYKVLEETIGPDSLAKTCFFAYVGNIRCMRKSIGEFSEKMGSSMLNYTKNYYAQNHDWSSEIWALEWMYLLDRQSVVEEIESLDHATLITLTTNLFVPLNDKKMVERVTSHLSKKEIADMEKMKSY